MKRARRGGFTLLELLIAIVVSVILAVLLVPMTTGCRRGCGGRQLKDSTQVRGLHQAFVTWAQNNRDVYPLPSLIDVNNATVSDQGAAKDHTANILSMLVFNGTISTELLISPVEASPSIKLKDDYEFDAPKAAADPKNALWDPSLSADFTSPSCGNISYGHVPPSGPRLALWSNSDASWAANRAVIGNRGPEVSAVVRGSGAVVNPRYVLTAPTSFLMHGSRSKWEGHIGFADNHVEFLTRPTARSMRDAKGLQREDVLFFDEPDDPARDNDFLGIFTRAGSTPAAFRSIWD